MGTLQAQRHARSILHEMQATSMQDQRQGIGILQAQAKGISMLQAQMQASRALQTQRQGRGT